MAEWQTYWDSAAVRAVMATQSRQAGRQALQEAMENRQVILDAMAARAQMEDAVDGLYVRPLPGLPTLPRLPD